MRVDHVPCGECVNESERIAVEHVLSKLRSHGASNNRWIVLSNVPSAVNDRAIPDEIDLVCIGPSGFFVIEVKHWDRAFLKSNETAVLKEATKLNDKVRRLVGKLRRAGIEPGFVTGRFLLTRDGVRWDNQRPEFHGCKFFGLTEWKQLLDVESGTTFDEAAVLRACQVIQPLSKVALKGEIRQIADVRNLELQSPREERFHRVYRGEHIRTRNKVILHLYDLSDSDDAKPDRLASREFEALQKLQHLACVPRLIDSFHDVPEYPGELCFFSLVDPCAPTVAERSGDAGWTVTARREFAARALKALAQIHNNDREGVCFVHRRIGPDTLLVGADNQPVFTAFDLSRISGTLTVSPGATVSETTAWVAPEVKAQGFAIADQRSDVYALCATLRLLFENTSDLAAQDAILTLMLGLESAPDQRQSLESIASGLDDKPTAPPPKQPLPPARYWSEGQEVEFNQKRFQIVSRLGSGSHGTTFKVEEIDGDQVVGCFAAKVVFDKTGGERALKAFRCARLPSCETPYLATICDTAPRWEENHFVAYMKWVNGTPLQEWREYVELYADGLGEEPRNLAQRWVKSACEGLHSLHAAGFVHGDVSPRNIIESGGDATLIDYDLLLPQGEPVWNIGTALYASPEKAVDQPAACSDDIYSLAAAMFHVLFTHEPFWYGGERRRDSGLNWDGLDRDSWGWLPAFLDRATCPQRDERFVNAMDALNWIGQQERQTSESRQNSDTVLGTTEQSEDGRLTGLPPVDVTRTPEAAIPELVVSERKANRIEWLAELLATYPGSPHGNIETRGLDSDFAKNTYVPTSLEAEIEDQIKQRKIQLIILCGNAGDGKTAFLQHLAGELGLPRHRSNERVCSGSVHGLNIKLNLDGAASFNGRSSDVLLDEIFQPFHDGRTASSKVHLVAVNDGRLLQWAEDYESRHNRETKLTQWIYATLLEDQQEDAPHIRLINLNARSLVGNVPLTDGSAGPPTTEFFDKLLDKLLGGTKADEIWRPCQSCAASSRCTTFRSVSMLRDQSPTGQEQAARVRQHLAEAMQAVHQRGQVHITTRELRGALTYILFGTQHCDDLHADPDLDGGHYWDRAFDCRSEKRQGELLTELPRFDPALNSEPPIDRYLRASLAGDGTNSAPTYTELNSLASRRRRAWFEWSPEDVQEVAGQPDLLTLYRGEHLRQFRDVATMSDDLKGDLCHKLCKGISRLEQLPRAVLDHAPDMPVVPLKILPRTPIETTFWVEKPISRFRLEDDRPVSDAVIEWLPNVLRLIYQSSDGWTETLRMSSDLFSLLLELADGYQLTDSSSDDVFANLKIFTQRLAQEDEREVFAWNPGDEDCIYRVGIVNNNGVQQLRLELASAHERLPNA